MNADFTCSKCGENWSKPHCPKCAEDEGYLDKCMQREALLRLLTAASLMRIAIKERATFLTRTTDWERLEDAMRNAERELKATNNQAVL